MRVPSIPAVTRDARSGDPALKNGPSVDAVVGVAGALHVETAATSALGVAALAGANVAAAVATAEVAVARVLVGAPAGADDVPVHPAKRRTTRTTTLFTQAPRAIHCISRSFHRVVT